MSSRSTHLRHISFERQSGQLPFNAQLEALLPSPHYFTLAPSAMRAQISAMRRTALTGFIFGLILGCFFGAAMDFLPGRDESKQRATLSVNQATGKPQLHVKGRPEIE